MASGGIMFSLWLAGEGTPPSPSSADLVSQLRELPAHMETSSCCYTLGAQGAEQPELAEGGAGYPGALADRFAGAVGTETV